MKAAEYEKIIKKNMRAVGTYRKEFDKTVKTLASIYEDLDEATEKFEEDERTFVVEHTNKNGSTNRIKNPNYLIIEGLRQSIILYNRELGLTPAGLKKINAKDATGKKEKSLLDAALADIAKG